MSLFDGMIARYSQRQSSVRLVVVDVETTGVYNNDRIVEVAAVTMSPDGTILDEWETLVNPGRDVGPTHLHGIVASMVSAAPRFEEIAGALGDRIHGGVLVAHNLPFDSRMIGNEYLRVGATLDPGSGVCTLRLCGERLDLACARYGIQIDHHHRALADARATARLLAAQKVELECRPAMVTGVQPGVGSRTLRRELAGGDGRPMPFLARLASRTSHWGAQGEALQYLDLLDWAIGDGELSARECEQLNSLALDLGMSSESVVAAHEHYLRELISAAARDQVITRAEHGMLTRVALALGLGTQLVEEAAQAWAESSGRIRISGGMGVCFTGQATYTDGSEMCRDVLCGIAESLGLRVEESVTKKRCDLLVASDPCSLSTKAQKARQYGIPVVALVDFLCTECGAEILVS
jgi:DNA polymerase-3 subunit epsilon